MQEINEDTKVKLFTVLVAIPLVATWLWYMASVAHDVAQGKITNERQDQLIQRNGALISENKEKTMIYLIEIDKRTIRIEEALKTKER